MKVTFRFEGGEEVARALTQLSERGSRAVQREALTEGAEVIRTAIASMAPRRPPAPDIADHIVLGRLNQTDQHGGGVSIGPEKGRYFYGKFLEYGTVKMNAQPFMRPAFDGTAEQALGVIGRALWRELAAKGISRTATVPSVPSGPGRTV